MHVNEKYKHATIDEKCSIKTERHQWSTTLFLVIKRVSKRYVNKQCFKRKQSENCVAQQMHCLFWIRWIDSKWSSACDQSVSLEKQKKNNTNTDHTLMKYHVRSSHCEHWFFPVTIDYSWLADSVKVFDVQSLYWINWIRTLNKAFHFSCTVQMLFRAFQCFYHIFRCIDQHEIGIHRCIV